MYDEELKYLDMWYCDAMDDVDAKYYNEIDRLKARARKAKYDITAEYYTRLRYLMLKRSRY